MNNYEIMMNGYIQIGEVAPDFEADTTLGKIKLSDYKGKWIVLFSHPGDFTPVCTTEIIAFARMNTYFEKLNTQLIGLSIDSINSHLAWICDIFLKTGIEISFPIIADRSGEIARKYGMIAPNISRTSTVRNVFIIDDKGIIRLILIYPMNIGRNISEIIRVINALQVADKNDKMAPANWVPCDQMIVPSPQDFYELKKRVNELKNEKNGMSWYLSFQKPDFCSTEDIQNLNFESRFNLSEKNKNFENNNINMSTNINKKNNNTQERESKTTSTNINKVRNKTIYWKNF